MLGAYPQDDELEASYGQHRRHIKVDIELPEEDEEVNDPASHVGRKCTEVPTLKTSLYLASRLTGLHCTLDHSPSKPE